MLLLELICPRSVITVPCGNTVIITHRFGWVGHAMKDMRMHLEKLQVQIAECEMIRDLASDPRKRELFTKLAQHFKVLAAEIEKAMTIVGNDPTTRA